MIFKKHNRQNLNFKIFLVMLLSGLSSCNEPLYFDSKYLYDCIGNTEESENVSKLIKSITCERSEKRFKDSYYYSYKLCGLILRFENDKKLSTIFLMSEGEEDFSEYKGKLPYNLDFNLNRSEVVSLIGKPEYDGDSFYEYHQKRMTIDFNDKDINWHKSKKSIPKIILTKIK
jgi:hypothetical protein